MDRIAWARANPVACPLPQTTTNVRLNRPGQLDVGCCCNIQYQPHPQWSEFLSDLRTSMDEQRRFPACALCYREESRGYQSERVRAILQMGDETFASYANGVTVNHHEIGISLGNLCPLACRSCQPSESSTYGKITKTSVDSIRQDVFQDPDLFDWIKQKLQWVHSNYSDPTIHLIGGETLVQPGLYAIMDWLIEQDMAQRFTVAMTTSLAVNLSDRLKHSLSKFYHVAFALSIDSVGDNFHYVRWPSRFDKIEQNLKLLRSWTDTIPRLSLSLNPVFSISNVFYLEEYLDYWHRYPLDMPIWPLHMWSPEYLAVENMPPEYQPALLQYLHRVKLHDYFKSRTADTLLQQIQSFCDSKLADDDDIFCHGMVWMADYDKRTGLTMAEHNDRLWNVLTPKHRQIYLDQLQRANTMISIYESVSHAGF